MRIIAILLSTVCFHCWGQQFFLKGTIRERNAGGLPLAHVAIEPDHLRLVAGDGGKFSVTLSGGKKSITITYVGYEDLNVVVDVFADLHQTFELMPAIGELNEVVVRSQRQSQEDIFLSNRMGTHTLTADDINAIPVLGGEADLIKTLQLLPGTIRGVEGTSDLFVRGGAADQNLVLLDGAPIYNTSHLFGFLSVFNPDILSSVEAINGGFPARYGGRLSSILDITTKSDIATKTKVSGDVGLIASRLYVEQPLLKDKASIWISCRRTYLDQVVKMIDLELPYFFYDLNAKLLLKPTARDRVEVAYYLGKDKLDLFRDRNGDGIGSATTYNSGNTSQTVRWRRLLTNGWNSEATLLHTSYKYDIAANFGANELGAFSDVDDLGAKLILTNDSSDRKGLLQTGIEVTRHKLSPNVINTSGVLAELLASSSSNGLVATEVVGFADYEWKVNSRLRFTTGLRASSAIVANAFYMNPEPRASVRYSLKKNSSLKASYSRMAQYLHRVSSSAVSSPTDIWYPVTDSIRPQTADQVALAWQKVVPQFGTMFSIEGYYKNMHSLVGYEEGTNLFFNTDFASRLIQGNGKAYGFEFLVRKQQGKLTGWLNCTLSWSWRKFDELNQGDWFHARYDRRHNGAVVLQYAITKQWAVSGVWEFISGSRFTPVIGQYPVASPTMTGIDLIPVYAPINSVKLSDTHRLDLGIKFRNRPDRKFQWQVFAGAYNVYNRTNPIAIIIEPDPQTGKLLYEQPGLFGFLPFVSYGFKF